MDVRWVNALVVGSAVAVMGLSGSNREARLIGADALGVEVATLEDAVASRPDDGRQVVRLANAYLDRGEPGLAMAALDHAPASLHGEADVAHARGRALFDQGHATEALAAERVALAACEVGPCKPWLVADAARRIDFFETMVGLGVEDPLADPEATHLAYTRSIREVRLAIR